MKSSTLTAILTSILFFNFEAQEYTKCKADLAAILPQKIMEFTDQGKEFKIIEEQLPNYSNTTSNTITITWFEYSRDLTSKELKDYKKRLVEFRKQLLLSFGGPFDKNTPKPWKVNDTTIIKANKEYKKRTKTIDKELPLFYRVDANAMLIKENADNVNEVTILESEIYRRYDDATGYQTSLAFKGVGDVPVFDLKQYKEFIWRYIDPKNGTFQVNNIPMTYDYGQNFKTSNISKFLWSIEHLNQIEKLKEFLHSEKITIIKSDNNYVKNPNVLSVQYNFIELSLLILYEVNNEKVEALIQGQNIHKSQGDFTFNENPIYQTKCVEEAEKVFNSLVLPSDFINNQPLKDKLTISIQKSSFWIDYEIKTIILTENSEWRLNKANQFSAFIDNRTLLANAYIQHKRTKKCSLVEVLFYQKNDPIEGFIYDIETKGMPEFLSQYPCNLK